MNFPVPPSQVHAARLSLPRPPVARGRQTSKPPRFVAYPESVSAVDTTTASSASSSFDASRRRQTPQPSAPADLLPYLSNAAAAYPPPIPQHYGEHHGPNSVPHMRQRSQDYMMRAPSPIPVYAASQMMTPVSMTPKSQRAGSSRHCRFLGDITVECIDCSPYVGRCGLIIFFLLTYGVKHRLSVLPIDTDLKNRVEILRKRRGGLVKPAWPICFHGHFSMTEPYATLRYLATQLGLYGRNPEKDYTADWLLESFAYWRDCLSTLIREPVYPESFARMDTAAVDAYLTETRPGFLDNVEKILELNETTFFLGEQMSWVDAPLFSILYEDNVYVYLTVKERVIEHSRLVEMHKDANLQDARSDEGSADDGGVIAKASQQSSGPLMPLQEFEDEMNKHITLVEDHYPHVARFMDSVPRQAGLLHGWLVEHRQIWNLALPMSDAKHPEPMGHAEDYGASLEQSEPMYMPRHVGNRPRSNAEHWITAPSPTELMHHAASQGRGPILPPHPGTHGRVPSTAASNMYGGELLWAEAPSPAAQSQRSYIGAPTPS